MLFLLLLFSIARYGADFWGLTGSFCGKMGQGVVFNTLKGRYFVKSMWCAGYVRRPHISICSLFFYWLGNAIFMTILVFLLLKNIYDTYKLHIQLHGWRIYGLPQWTECRSFILQLFCTFMNIPVTRGYYVHILHCITTLPYINKNLVLQGKIL